MFSTLNPAQPMIMVHRGWKDPDTFNLGQGNGYWTGAATQNGVRSRRNTEPTMATTPRATQTFEFVNIGTTTARKKDPNVRKLVRAHVVKDWSRRKKIQRLQLEKLKGRRIESSGQQPEPPGSQTYESLQEFTQLQDAPQRVIESMRTPLPSPKIGHSEGSEHDSFGSIEEASVLMESPQEVTGQVSQLLRLRKLLLHQPDPDPQLSPILYHIRSMGVAMFPLVSLFKFNPLCPDGCVGWHLNDKAVYHSILYTTTSYANLISGIPESKDAIMHVSKTVAMVNKRLKEINEAGNGHGVDEGIIGAVGCIALTEALRGNLEGWKIHMSGVKHLTGINGISRLSTNLRFKLYRADLNGAIGFLVSPFFSGADAPTHLFPHAASYAAPYSPVSPSSNNLHQILTPLPISQDLINILFSMSDLSRTVSDVLSTRAQCSVSQQAIILDQTYSIQYSLLKPWSNKHWKALNPMEELLRVAGLLYMHATWQDFPFAALGSSKLIKRLKELVMVVKIGREREEDLIVWMLFMGAISAGKADSRIWFIAHLHRLTGDLSLDTWDVVKAKLESLWWVERIHGKLCRGVWDEVVVLNSVMVGEDFI